MQRFSVLIFDLPTSKGGKLIADYTNRCQPVFSTSEKGFESCSFKLRISEDEQLTWYRRRLAFVRIEAMGHVAWEGQIREPTVSTRYLSITAYGGAVSYTDVPYIALWSSTRYEDWQPVTRLMLSSRNDSRYSIETTDRLYIAPNGGDGIDTNNIGSVYLKTPDGGSRQIVAISADYKVLGKTSTWTASISRFNSSFGFLSTVWSVTGTGAVATGTITLSGLSACDMLMANFYLDRAGTTLGTTIAAGSRTVTPGSMTGIVVGMKLAIGGANPEEVTVTATTGTTFTAVFQYAHNLADTVSFIWEGETDDCYLELTNVRVKTTSSANLYPDEIIKDMQSAVATVNPNWVNTSAALISSSSIELRDELYEDMYPIDVVGYLLSFGDNSGNAWEFAVWEDMQVTYGRRGVRGRIWYVDETPEIRRALDRLYNSVYAVYTDSAGIVRRTAANTSVTSVASHGITRRAAVTADTDNAVVAGQIRDTALNDTLDAGNYNDVPIKALFDIYGSYYPLWMCRAGDTIVMRGGPFGYTTASDRSRAFIIAATNFDANTGDLTISPEARGPRLASYEARRNINLK